jgi:hypothetical protein
MQMHAMFIINLFFSFSLTMSNIGGIPGIQFSSSFHSHASLHMYISPCQKYYHLYFHNFSLFALLCLSSHLSFLYHPVIVWFIYIKNQSRSPQCSSSRTSHSQSDTSWAQQDPRTNPTNSRYQILHNRQNCSDTFICGNCRSLVVIHSQVPKY